MDKARRYNSVNNLENDPKTRGTNSITKCRKEVTCVCVCVFSGVKLVIHDLHITSNAQH